MGREKTAWTYCDHAGYFQQPMPLDLTESMVTVKNDLLMGIYDVPEFKPPHHEYNVKGGWNFHTRNEKEETLGEFGTMPRHRMAPKERMYAERLERTLQKAKQQEARDAFMHTNGFVKKQLLEHFSPEWSCMKRNQKPWVDQTLATHTYFETPSAYKPGEQRYETGIQEYIVEPERRKNYDKDIVAGDAYRKSFWRLPKRALHGTTRRADKARELARSCWDRSVLRDVAWETEVVTDTRKGRRLGGAAALNLLREFASVIYQRYPTAEAAFEAFDINGSGTIGPSEFEIVSRPIFRGDTTRVFKALDVDREGDISIEEFKFLELIHNEQRVPNLKMRSQRSLPLRRTLSFEPQAA